MKPGWILWLLLGAAPLLILVLIGGYLLLGDSLEAPIGRITDQGLVFDTRFLAGPIPLTLLQPNDARRVDLRRDTEYRTTLRENGIAVSDYRVGWFRLANGEKAFVALDSKPDALYLPTDAGYVILMDADTGSVLLTELREAVRMNDDERWQRDATP